MNGFRQASIVLLALALTAACAPGQHEQPGPGYEKGVYRTVYDKPLNATYEAAVKAVTELGMTIRKSDKSDRGAVIEATRPDDMLPVTIIFKTRTENATRASIQVGANGDEPYSRIVARSIAGRLKG